MTTCPCGEEVTSPRARKFCSKSCAGRYGGGKTPPSSECRACGADLTDDANVYVGKSGPRKGHRRCRRCVLAAGQPDYVPGPKGAPKAQAGKRRPRPKPIPAPTPIRPEPEVPVWRPPGWAPVPQVRRVAS